MILLHNVEAAVEPLPCTRGKFDTDLPASTTETSLNRHCCLLWDSSIHELASLLSPAKHHTVQKEKFAQNDLMAVRAYFVEDVLCALQ